MAINIGYIEGTLNGSLVVRIYYDPAWLNTDPNRDPGGAPLVNGPRGFCFDVTNTSGRNQRLEFSSASQTITATVGQGDPVTSGNGRSRTAAQMAALGFSTRGDVQNFQIG